jgi:hypothetical protein
MTPWTIQDVRRAEWRRLLDWILQEETRWMK